MASDFSELYSLPSDMQEALLNAVQAAGEGLRADMITRVHVKGVATDNSPIGTYSESYKKQRIKKKRQVSFVDLKVTALLQQSLLQRPTADGLEIGYPGGGKTDKETGVSAAQKMRFAEVNKRWGSPGKGRPIIDPTNEEIDSFIKSAATDFIRRL